MATSKSAIKRIGTSDKERIRNKSRRSAIKTSEKKFRAAVAEGNFEKATAQLQDVFKKLDKAAKAGTYHKNKSDRKKSRLATVLNKAQ